MSKVKEESLGEIIKKAIEASGLKQSVIADRMGYKRQTINQIDRKKTFDLEFLQKLKDASGLDFTDFVFNKNTSQPKYKVPDNPPSIVSDPHPEEKDLTVEMSVTIKIKADPAEVNKMSELIVSLKKEASKLGFAIG